MSLSGTLEADIDIKASSDRFYKALSNELHKLLDASDNVHAVDVHHGDWTTPGSIKLWKYTIGTYMHAYIHAYIHTCIIMF